MQTEALPPPFVCQVQRVHDGAWRKYGMGGCA